MSDSALIWLDGLAADLRDEDRFAHGEAWHPQEHRGLGRCAYCPGDEPWPCPWQKKVDRIGQQVAHIRALLVADAGHGLSDPDGRDDPEFGYLVDSDIRPGFGERGGTG